MSFFGKTSLETPESLQCQHLILVFPTATQPTTMQVKHLSRATGVDTETIRFYEKEGLLPEPPRLANGYRDYGTAHLERLAFIRHCRALDMPLPDVRRLLQFLDNPHGHCGDVNTLVDTQLARVRARLASMQALEKQLLTLRGQCSGDNGNSGGTREGTGASPACGILKELVAAAHGEACT